MEFNGEERIAFALAKGQRKYGSTSRFKRNGQTLVYNVQEGDTMQGIAVKFGITTEQIRRTNQMWTNDSLFLRDKLLIPCISDDVKSNQSNQSVQRSSLGSDADVDMDDSSRSANTSSITSSQEETTTV